MNCPTCGSPDTAPIQNARPERGRCDPGELAIYECREVLGCPTWIAVVPEPSDGYL